MLKKIFVFLVFIMLWWLIVAIFSLPAFILPSPDLVLFAFVDNYRWLFWHGLITFSEIIIGLILGIIIGTTTALFISSFKFLQDNLRPIVIASQALPVFAIAPLLILWFGLGLGSKIAMAVLIIYFPICSTLCDGLANVNKNLLDLAKLYQANKWQQLFYFKLPAALPALASGIKLAVNVAPIGAVVGEWVGAAAGLGFIINQANARLQVDIVFAAIFLLIAFVLLLRYIVDMMLARTLHWIDK